MVVEPSQKETGMYEYKVETYKVKEAQNAMNALASEGWRVIAVTPNQAMGFGIVVTYERKCNEYASNRKTQTQLRKYHHIFSRCGDHSASDYEVAFPKLLSSIHGNRSDGCAGWLDCPENKNRQ